MESLLEKSFVLSSEGEKDVILIQYSKLSPRLVCCDRIDSQILTSYITGALSSQLFHFLQLNMKITKEADFIQIVFCFTFVLCWRLKFSSFARQQSHEM